MADLNCDSWRYVKTPNDYFVSSFVPKSAINLARTYVDLSFYNILQTTGNISHLNTLLINIQALKTIGALFEKLKPIFRTQYCKFVSLLSAKAIEMNPNFRPVADSSPYDYYRVVAMVPADSPGDADFTQTPHFALLYVSANYAQKIKDMVDMHFAAIADSYAPEL